MRTILKTLWLILLLLFVAAPASANTRFGFGTIIDVDEKGERSGRGGKPGRPGFTVCYEFFNLSSSAVLKHTFYPFEGKTRHGWRVYFLDGKPSTWQEAVKPGRAVCVSDNEMVCWVSSGPGPATDVPPGTASDGWLQVVLKRAVGATVAKTKRGNTKTENVQADVELLLDVKDGTIRAAAAVVGGLGPDNVDFVVDASALTYVGGKLGGAFALTARFPADGDVKLEQGDSLSLRYTLDAAVAADGKATGSFTGTCGAAEVSGEVSVICQGRKPRPDPGRIWLLLRGLHGGKFYYVVVPVAEGKGQSGGDFLYSKGHRLGSVPEADLTIDGTRIRGRISIEASKPAACSIDAVILGDRLIFGAWTEGDGNAAVTGSLRGGVAPSVEDGPQIRGAFNSKNPEQEQAVRALQAKLYAKENQ